VVDLDAATVAVLRAHRKQRGSIALQLARDDALVLGDQEGRHLHPERLGHASPVITMQVYAHVLPGSQREAAELFASLVEMGKAQ
jgi:integrase